MAQWRKRKFDDYSVDFETLEDIFSELIDVFERDGADLRQPLKLGFSVSLDSDGCIRIDEFGVLNQIMVQQTRESIPLVEVIDFDKEILVVVETSNLPERDIDIKVLENALIVSRHNSKRQLKKIFFPSAVKESTLKTNYNNGVLELRLMKRNEAQANIANTK